MTRSPASLTFSVSEENKIREKKFLRGKCNYTILTRYLFENASHITSESCRLLIQWGKEQKLYKSDLTSRNFGWGDKSITTKWNFISKVDSKIYKSLKELINRYGTVMFIFFFPVVWSHWVTLYKSCFCDTMSLCKWHFLGLNVTILNILKQLWTTWFYISIKENFLKCKILWLIN